eukprot:CAMPEP_0176490282 /NCGR_PEP_ID=MMETSP0200_2-20121128/7784_1 /TAXON_ID=947934 /ORGANISM="Chaetoceros sp., Strain GSL56" /LENGTH=279 /DNA_ID=CAMNT_0017887571 /DNA_START=116 /DNA_END=955 /DNA_ORIENTATION=-
MNLLTLLLICVPTSAFFNSPITSNHAVRGGVMQLNAAAANTSNRRNLFANAAAAASAILSFSQPSLAASESADLVDVYFGVGCFWHIQHEFVEAERKLLSRGDKELTSRTGYAGGTATDKEGRVCYHNLQGVADYGKLGHGEVVGMRIPKDKIGAFAKEYFDLFTEKGERVDPLDRGGEYRSLLGLPGGINNDYYKEVEAAAVAKCMKLELGKGNDPDTIGTKKVYVYDTTKFPFYQAEIYHQFHNDFQSPPYGKKYNSLANQAFEEGRLSITGCPDRI